jgi:hypothetical protein
MTPEVTLERESWAKVPLWLLTAVSPTAVVVYGKLSSYAWMRDGARPAVQRLADELGLSARTVQRSLSELAENGALDITERFSEVGQQLPSRYHIRTTRREGDKSVTLADTDVTHVGDKSVTGGVTNLSPETDVLQTELEVERERRASADPAPPKPKRTSTSTRGTRIAADWLPEPQVRQAIVAELRGFDDDWFRRQHANFIDHFLGAAGAKGVKVDWNATWRKWMRSSAEGNYPVGGGTVHQFPRRPEPKPAAPTEGQTVTDPAAYAW